MFLRPDPDLGWIPTHVQVTVLQARGLRAKGKHGTSDAYTLIQIGRDKYSTSVVEKTPGSPEWKEECSFELAPGALERGEGCQLQLTVMHRALIGMDQFLGQVSIPLQQVYQQGRSLRNQWYNLRSKPGKKEKERGEIQVHIQFTRNNLTASMFDLSIKDKPKTPFGKLKDKMKVKKRFDMESSSAIVPSSVGRLDSDDDDERKPKSKAAAFFKGLRKNSLTKSNTSLGSDSTISSTSATVPTSAGITIVLPDPGKKPASRNSSLSAEPTAKDNEASPRMTHKRAFSDEVSQLKMFPEPKSIQNLKISSSPISKSSLCINGSHVYAEVPLPKPPPSPLEKSLLPSKSFQNIVKRSEEPILSEGSRGQSQGWEKPDKKLEQKPSAPNTSAMEEEKISAKANIQRPKKEEVPLEAKPVQITTPMFFTDTVSTNKPQEITGKEEKKAKVNLFHHGTGKNEAGGKTLVEQATHGSSVADDKGKAGGWFGSKEAKDVPQKPSFPSGSIATSEAAERGSSLVEEHSPLAFSSSTEDWKNPSSQYSRDHGDAFTEGHNFKFTPSSSSVGRLNAAGWEQQFDALASSRLQPVANNQCLPDTKLQDPSASHYLSSDASYSTERTGVLSEESKTSIESEHMINTLPSIYTSYVSVKVLETHWPVDALTTEEVSPSLPNVSVSQNTPYIPLAEYTRSRTPTQDLSRTYNHDTDMSDPPAAGYEINNLSLCRLDKEVTELSGDSVLQNPTSGRLNTTDHIQAMCSEVNKVDTANTSGDSESRVAAVSPLVPVGDSMARLLDSSVLLFDNHAFNPTVPPLHRAITEETIDREDVFNVNSKEKLEYSAESEGKARMESMSNRLHAVPDQVTVTSGDDKGVNQSEIGLRALIDSVGSLAPPKPPRLMSSVFEGKGTNGDNYKQTSNQDTSRKRAESPEEQRQEPNVGVSKETVSPVICCPIIEVNSPEQLIGEDTQSPAKGPLPSLMEENNDLTKLGTTNGEHLLDVNETLAEQFRTCPSKVSLDALDLSSVEESSNKLDVLKRGPGSELIDCGHSEKLRNVEVIKQKCDLFLKPLPVSKKDKEVEMESSDSSKKVERSNVLFWSALEEPLPNNITNHSEVNQIVEVKCGNLLQCEEVTAQGHIVEDNTEPKENLKIPETKSEKILETSTKGLKAESQSGISLSQLSTWSADIIVDFKNEEFWRSESDLLEATDIKSLPSPGNPFTPANKTPPVLSHKNPFVEPTNGNESSEVSLQEDISFQELHRQAALKVLPPITLPTDVKIPSLHGNQPLAFSTPSLVAVQNPKVSKFPSPILSSTTSAVTGTTNTCTAALSYLQSPATSSVVTSATRSVLPQETQPAESPFYPLKTSPHPVKPISAALSDSEKKPNKPALSTAISSGLEMLKSVTGGQHPAPKKQELDRLKDLCSPDAAARYYHLTHDELIHMLLQKEAELGRKEEHVHELEDYIDKLMVRIIEQAPTLLQVPLETTKNNK
ncbi:rab11 family-interacting protein 5 [Spea bombifrons]|uniref:rab11 family-interacting protein 5 n=1 Tax=Spea bombifrons TaxID=233779 RepID=UPI002349D97C|nr:rab11 family-interacting protein 5 [Spea bombifrons]